MNTRLLILKILCFTLLISCTEHHKEISGRPNIVLVMADDQGWGDLSTHKNPHINTPHIDKFKTEGVSLERFFVAPVCAPTRAGVLSGQWGIRTGAWGVTNRDEVMRTETVTIAELLRQAGYKTGIFGKWHNGAQYPENPKGQGFDEFLGFTAGHWNNYFDTTLKNIDDIPVRTEGYITDVFTDAAIAFIKENKDHPFFCYIPYNAPHSPFQVPDHYFSAYKAKGINDKDACIYGMCENIDDNFGKLLDMLDKEHLAANTIVIFMSDNGPNGKRYNERMKGIKATNDEGGTRVPFFIRWPGKIPAGVQRNTIAGHIDILPTLAKLCAIALPEDMALDGM
ncbi:MAG: arylsulfatase, partial [Bacteroidota bacterium]